MFDPSKPRSEEPFFTLLGRDPASPHIIRAWCYWRMGQLELAQSEAAKAGSVYRAGNPQNRSGDEQIISAFKLADEMEIYHRNQITGGGS